MEVDKMCEKREICLVTTWRSDSGSHSSLKRWFPCPNSVQFCFVIIRVAVFNFAFNYLIENALCEMKTISFENKSNSSGDICIFRLSAYSICSCCMRTNDDRSVGGRTIGNECASRSSAFFLNFTLKVDCIHDILFVASRVEILLINLNIFTMTSHVF